MIIKQRLSLFLVVVFILSIPSMTLAFNAEESDAFYLGAGSANIELKDNNALLSGSNINGGVRVGILWILFGELGYGATRYSDIINVSGIKKKIDFRTTGPYVGGGLMLPIRKMLLGAKAHVSKLNKWSEEIFVEKTVVDGVTIFNEVAESRKSGNIDFESYFAFVIFGGFFEAGIRRDVILLTDSSVTNSFGPYLSINFRYK
ncbi:MAG: hypothetical protein OEY59_03525 [Deltaproteobacteria bacterium]|nr:hypothetical protein [Deltaproteobacteria bacterium]